MNKKFIIIGLINLGILLLLVTLVTHWGHINPAALPTIPEEVLKPNDPHKNWQKIKSIPFQLKGAKFIASHQGDHYIASDTAVLHSKGTDFQIVHLVDQLKYPITAIAINPQDRELFIAETNQIKQGKTSLISLNQRAYITDMLIIGDRMIIADAGNREVLCYQLKGKLLWKKQGYEDQLFKVPSPYFSLTSDGEGGIWVTDPGRFQCVRFNDKGDYVATWAPLAEERFFGCCNPTHICMINHGQFITLEKGRVRLRLFEPSGVIKSIIADEDAFQSRGSHLYDLSVIDDKNLILLDGNKQCLKFFQEQNNESHK